MDIIGLLIEHATFGVGYIASITDGIMMIQFSKEQKRFLYPSAFESHLVVVDEKAREDISREISQMQREEAMRVEENEKNQVLESEQKQAIRLDDKHKPKREKSAVLNASRSSTLPDGKHQTFFVFQGKTFTQESKGGYIWAPLSSASGRSFHHWDKLLEVKPGDIIFHGCNANIVAISIAKGECYEAPRPVEFDEDWIREGRRIDCEYLTLVNPIPTSRFREDIIRLSNVMYAPFRRDGNGNMGYLFTLDRELASILYEGILRENKYLRDRQELAEFL